jgi:L-serine kinase (ADP)
LEVSNLAQDFDDGLLSRRRQVVGNPLVKVRFALVPIGDLKTHEVAQPDRVRRVMKQIRSTGMVKKAITVDAKSMVVLDGAHRYNALKKLGAERVPVWLLDYSDEDIIVLSKDRKSRVPKEDVIKAATVGPKLNPKSTRHMVKAKDGTLVHISKLEGDVSVPLSTLMRPDRVGPKEP